MNRNLFSFISTETVSKLVRDHLPNRMSFPFSPWTVDERDRILTWCEETLGEKAVNHAQPFGASSNWYVFDPEKRWALWQDALWFETESDMVMAKLFQNR